MTVQFLAAWNGYEEDQVATLSAPEEARLIGLGLCRAYVAGQDGRSLVPVVQDPVSGSQFAGSAPVSGAGTGNRLVRMAVTGDSREAVGLSVSGNDTRYGASSPANWARSLSGQAVELVGIVATNGWYIEDAIANLSAITALRPDICQVKIGINNIMYTSQTAEEMLALRATLHAGIAAAGIQPWVYTELPAYTGKMTSGQIDRLLALNSLLRKHAADNNYVLIDAFSAVVDPTANPVAAVSSYIVDPGTVGIHWNNEGARQIGKLIAAEFSRRYQPRTPLVYSAGDNRNASAAGSNNLIEYSLFLGSGGTAGTATALPLPWSVHSASAWATGVAVTANAYRSNAGNVYQAVGAGTTGATAPTHTSGTVSDGTISWTWVSTVAVPAGAYRSNAGNVYQAVGAGTAGATAPTHTSGTVSDGTVSWAWVGWAVIPQGWTVQRTAGTCTIVAFATPAHTGYGRSVRMLITYASSSDLAVVGYTGGVPFARFSAGKTYVARAAYRVLPGATGLKSPQMFFSTTVGGVARGYYDMLATIEAFALGTEEIKGTFSTPPATLSAAPTLVSNQVWFAGASAGYAEVEVCQMCVLES